ncbi:MAG: putative Pre-rRNA-processing protein HuESF1 [Streblomastix strix]|uniref:Putative Pre-rRNA-processing protein HuESF1 n=1 Tax=Streblomastix strix TaxID=222440 RepID=A0A5J4VHP5_9EUKA|nr:MAG: putative Pre-rRNA-processing protein HuESF1 [Streblomastix strix]
MSSQDKRFASSKTDPRFRRQKKYKNNAKLDQRFGKLFKKNRHFGTQPQIDEYGRTDEDSREEDSNENSNHISVDEEVGSLTETQNRKDEEYSGSNSDSDIENQSEQSIEEESGSTTSEELDNINNGVQLDIENGIPTIWDSINGTDSLLTDQETSRLALVNVDWESVRTKDIYMILHSFLPQGGVILNVKLYLSDFGEEILQKDVSFGPRFVLDYIMNMNKNQQDNEKKENKQENMLNSNEMIKQEHNNYNDQDVEKGIYSHQRNSIFLSKEQRELQTKQESEAVREYEATKLRYFYAIIECDSKETASVLYNKCDRVEINNTSNIMDLRFVPDSETFEKNPVETFRMEDELLIQGKRYKPPKLIVDALNRSSVELSWDRPDPERKRILSKQFTDEELEEMDFKAYLAKFK